MIVNGPWRLCFPFRGGEAWDVEIIYDHRGQTAMMIVHPGRVLKRELEARELSANALALALRTPTGRITDILNSKRGISPETAMRLGRYFGNGARFWLNLQMGYELASAERDLGQRVSAEVLPAA